MGLYKDFVCNLRLIFLARFLRKTTYTSICVESKSFIIRVPFLSFNEYTYAYASARFIIHVLANGSYYS